MKKKKRILIVDDNKAIHEDFRKILNATKSESGAELDDLKSALFGKKEGQKQEDDRSGRSDYSIDSAFQGEEALKLVEAAAKEGAPFSVVFMDMRMPPGWDGLETIEKIWEKHPEIEMVICSAYSDYSWDDILKRLGKSDRLLFLKKPFEAVEIQQMALALTTKWELAKELTERITNQEAIIRQRTQELELQRAKSLQSSKLASLGEVASGIAHEINSPLSAIQLKVEILEDLLNEDPLDRKNVLEVSATIGSIVSKIADIIKGLRNFSRDGESDPLTQVSISKIVQDTLTLCCEKFSQHRIKLITDKTPEHLQIHVRPVQISQVLLNLLNNAHDAIEKLPEKWIEIEASEQGNFVVISVTDSGKGVPKHIQEKIFQPFFTTKDIGKGTGLGLSISKGLIEGNHGELTFDPAAPNTRFVIRLPKKGG